MLHVNLFDLENLKSNNNCSNKSSSNKNNSVDTVEIVKARRKPCVLVTQSCLTLCNL